KMQGFLPSPDSAEEIAGKGVKAVIDGKSYLCGSYKLMNDCEIDLSNVPVANLYLSDGSKILGYIRIGDTLKPEAEKSLASLKSLGSQQNIMLTGDRREQAEMTAKFLAIDEIRSDLLPQQKVEELFKIKASGTTVFVGDGINDGPVLAAADLGIAMGMGSDLATQTADIVLLSNNLCSIPSAVKICRQGMRIVQGNIAFILLVKALVLLLSGIFGVPMFVAIFADVGVTLLTILNSLRILTVKTGV
ncbi:MAG: HAD-IC family P-type ATPase, partial [Oscillospiraceae bacterium]